ncbi:MAG: tripartite tricarboxylate transporter TctB family protein [Spirochaetaceae bacterium]|nr:MAG: tripartite tricarboxylate transporter TctB family protein [Spirochaetaceae bacterium]
MNDDKQNVNESSSNQDQSETLSQPSTSDTRKYSLNFPILLLLIGVTTLYFSSQLPVFIQRGQRLPGPQYFPTMLGVFFCVASVVELLRYISCRRRHASGCGDQADPRSEATTISTVSFRLWSRIERVARNWGNQSVALLLGALLVFVLILPSLGFLLTGFAFSLLILLRLKARPVPAVLLSVALVVIIAFIFVSAFRVPLPRGILSLPF